MKFIEYAETVSSIKNEGGCEVEIDVKRDEGVVTIWLTNDDQKDETLQSWLKERYPLWRAQKLMPVVYHSGREDLYENTLALLRHNRRVSAQRELAEDHKLQKGRLATR